MDKAQDVEQKELSPVRKEGPPELAATRRTYLLTLGRNQHAEIRLGGDKGRPKPGSARGTISSWWVQRVRTPMSWHLQRGGLFCDLFRSAWHPILVHRFPNPYDVSTPPNTCSNGAQAARHRQ